MDVADLDPSPEASDRVKNGDVVSVYVYENIPELDHSFLLECYHDRYEGVPPWQDEIADMAENMGEIWLHHALLSHPWRVLDPEKADLFYVPIYPVLSRKVEDDRNGPWVKRTEADIQESRCQGSTHSERMNAAVTYLSWSSPFFNRFGGADHVIVCAWWNCREVFSAWHRMVLRRTVVGINERIFAWARWGCGRERMVTVPYTANSVLTATNVLGGAAPEDRDIPFFFAGTSRGRPERENLKVVKTLSKSSMILEEEHQKNWGLAAEEYASHIARSRFCFCPRGDTESSRRLFDAVAAGCIPIITERGTEVLPYIGNGLDYSKLAVVVDSEALQTPEGVEAITMDLITRSDEELADLRSGLRAALKAVLFGATEGPETSDMRPFLGTATNFLQASYPLARGGGEGGGGDMWKCPETGLSEGRLAARTDTQIPPGEKKIGLFLSESETIVNKERSLLVCAVPNAGSLQFRMLAKRMQGVPHWNVADDRSLLFDRAASELTLLDTTDADLMRSIYHDNGSGWIKIGVVRDPVTRMLSAYLDIVRTWRAGWQEWQEHRQQAPLHHRRRRWLRQPWEQEGNGRQGSRSEGGMLVGAGSEWSLLDAILDARRGRRRRLAAVPSQGDGKNKKANTPGNNRGNAATRGAGGVAIRGGDGGVIAAAGGDKAGTVPGLEGETPQLYGARFSGGSGERRLQVREGETPQHHPFRHVESKERGEHEESASRKETEGPGSEIVEEKGEWPPLWKGSTNNSATDDDTLDVPTFRELVQALRVGVFHAPTAFRPAASLCGQTFSQFDVAIPFERLQDTSVEVVKSLQGDIWGLFGASGWGPDGKHAFMEFDYGGGRDENPPPERARELFDGGSCAWAEHYGDMETLQAVGRLFKKDYNRYRWYTLDPWKERLEACLNTGGTE